jgi:hypothetical protein
MIEMGELRPRAEVPPSYPMAMGENGPPTA